MTVDCYKEKCPRLSSCLISEAVRPDPLSCCKVCPKLELTMAETPESPERESEDQYPVITGHNGQKLNDMGRERSGLDILASGGCAWKGNYHENGDTWHPHVMPWGEMKCVTCSCKVMSKNMKYVATFLTFPSHHVPRMEVINTGGNLCYDFRTVKRDVRRNIVQCCGADTR